MKRIKVFNDSVSSIERVMNNWIDDADPKIISISGTRENGYGTVIVLYEDDQSEGYYSDEESDDTQIDDDEDELSLKDIDDGLDDAIVEGDGWHKNLAPGFEQQAYEIYKKMNERLPF